MRADDADARASRLCEYGATGTGKNQGLWGGLREMRYGEKSGPLGRGCERCGGGGRRFTLGSLSQAVPDFSRPAPDEYAVSRAGEQKRDHRRAGVDHKTGGNSEIPNKPPTKRGLTSRLDIRLMGKFPISLGSRRPTGRSRRRPRLTTRPAANSEIPTVRPNAADHQPYERAGELHHDDH